MKPRYIYMPLAAGILAPLLVMLALELFVGRSPRYQLLISSILGLELFLRALPFVPLILIVWLVAIAYKYKYDLAQDRHAATWRLEFIFWGGLIAQCAFMVHEYWTFFYPFYAGLRVSSTHTLGWFAMVFWSFWALALGLAVGWGGSFLWRPTEKNSKAA